MESKDIKAQDGNNKIQEKEEELMRQIITPYYPKDPYEVLGERNFADPRIIPVSEKGTPVQEFYRDAVVFVTGGTGFLGMVLVEKLIRSCPHLSRVYVLVRAKKGQLANERYDQTLKNSLFKRLRHEVPHFRTKISVVNGSIEKDENMALSTEDRTKLVQEVNIVFHCAATVRFDEKLSVAMSINFIGTRNMLKLAKEMKNLKVFMQVSTAYSNCILKRIEEKIYPNKYDYRDILEKMKLNEIEELDEMEKTILKEWPNTYTFSKSLTEIMVSEEYGGLPVAIARPSVVVSTYREPVKGWTNNLFGPNGPMLAYACGIMHLLPCHENFNFMDAIPADFVVNGLLCAAAEVANNSKSKKDSAIDNVPVYNFVNGNRNMLRWKDTKKICKSTVDDFPFTYTLWYPFIINIDSYTLFSILSFLLHTIPSYLMDIVLRMMGIEFSLTRLHRKISEFRDKVTFFTYGAWSFGYRRTQELWNGLTPEDREKFLFDVEYGTYEKAIPSMMLGLRTYYLKESFHTLPAARKRMKRLYKIHKFIIYFFKAFAVYLIYKIALYCS